MGMPAEVEALQQTLSKVPGIHTVEIHPRGVEEIDEKVLGFPGEFADLPQVALRRTKGGLKNEVLVGIDMTFSQDHAGWVGVEFLAWWVRDMARTGFQVQMRPLALPPKAYGTQLGRTLHFVIEFFLVLPDESMAPVLAKAKELARDLAQDLKMYADVLAKPTMAHPETLKELQLCAEREDAQAQLTLANALAQGNGKDAAQAFGWYQRAAAHGHPTAIMRLGLCYRNGAGVAKDAGAAFAQFSKAAEGGNPTAMGLLGNAYETGSGVGQDEALAAKWYAKGREQGDVGCTAQLGEMYEKGKGVRRDLQEALACYQEALEAGLEAVKPAIERVTKALKS